VMNPAPNPRDDCFRNFLLESYFPLLMCVVLCVLPSYEFGKDEA
jgi:hypothetical protein